MPKEEKIQSLIDSGMNGKEACKRVKYSLQRWYSRAARARKQARSRRPIPAPVVVTETLTAHGVGRVSLVTGTPSQIAEVMRGLQ